MTSTSTLSPSWGNGAAANHHAGRAPIISRDIVRIAAGGKAQAERHGRHRDKICFHRFFMVLSFASLLISSQCWAETVRPDRNVRLYSILKGASQGMYFITLALQGCIVHERPGDCKGFRKKQPVRGRNIHKSVTPAELNFRGRRAILIYIALDGAAHPSQEVSLLKTRNCCSFSIPGPAEQAPRSAV
mgnify:CR=1 FL=1